VRCRTRCVSAQAENDFTQARNRCAFCEMRGEIMQTVNYKYQGHSIIISMTEERYGRWRWAYAIDGNGYWQCEDRPRKSYEVTLNLAKQSAEFDASHMEWTSPQ